MIGGDKKKQYAAASAGLNLGRPFKVETASTENFRRVATTESIEVLLSSVVATRRIPLHDGAPALKGRAKFNRRYAT